MDSKYKPHTLVDGSFYNVTKGKVTLTRLWCGVDKMFYGSIYNIGKTNPKPASFYTRIVRVMNLDLINDKLKGN